MRKGGWGGAALAAALLLLMPSVGVGQPGWRTVPGLGRPVGPSPRRRVTPPPAEGEIVVAILVKPDLGEAGYELFTMNLDGSNRLQITDDDKQEFLPHFSPPDGKRLVFTRFVTGSYSVPGAGTHVVLYDFAARRETDLGEGRQPAWSPDGSRLAFLSRRFGSDALCVMNADGSGAHEIARPSGDETDQQWGDPAWSIDDWILLTVAENRGGACFKVRLDRFRPDGTERTQVTNGGPNCTPAGKEQSGDADPGISFDGKTIFTSRGYPYPPAGGIPAMTERRLVSLSADAWLPGKHESDLSLPAFPSCIEGVPKGSPDGRRVLLFRACPANGAGGMALTDDGGTFRRFLGEGFGADWHPLADSRADRDARATWRAYPTISGSASGAPFAPFDAEWRLAETRESLVSLTFRLRAAISGGGTTLALLLYNFEMARFEKVLVMNPSPSAFLTQEIELGDLRYVRSGDGTVRARVLATGAPEGGPVSLLVDQLRLESLAIR